MLARKSGLLRAFLAMTTRSISVWPNDAGLSIRLGGRRRMQPARMRATRAALAVSASAAIRFCGSEPGCTTPADMIKVAASSALISISMILLFGT